MIGFARLQVNIASVSSAADLCPNKCVRQNSTLNPGFPNFLVHLKYTVYFQRSSLTTGASINETALTATLDTSIDDDVPVRAEQNNKLRNVPGGKKAC